MRILTGVLFAVMAVAQNPPAAADVIYVVGDVAAPGTYSARDVSGKPVTVATILSAMTRPKGAAVESGGKVVVFRKDKDGVKREIPVSTEDIARHPRADFALQPGDIVFVPARTH